MKISALVVAAGCLLPMLAGAQTPPPFAPDKQYSADETITTTGGPRVLKVYYDKGNARTEMNTSGMNMVAIMRLDEGKMYSVMPAQKMVMEMPLNADAQKKMTASNPDNAKFELVGPDTINSVACTKYKMTSQDGQVMFWWVNAADKTPVRIATPDGTTAIDFKNYKAGPQDASLFEPPAGYQVMQMPAGMGGGGAPGAAPGGAPGGAPSGAPGQ